MLYVVAEICSIKLPRLVKSRCGVVDFVSGTLQVEKHLVLVREPCRSNVHPIERWGEPPLVGSFHFGDGENIRRAAGIWKELDRQLPGVRGVWVPNETRNNIMAIVSLKQIYGGHAKQAAMAVAGSYASAYSMKYIVLVDEDVDPSNISEVLWAIATRCEPEDDIDFVRELWGSHSDPRVPPDRKKHHDVTHSLAIIYACKPFAWKNDFPPSVKSSPQDLEKTSQKWGKLLFG